MLPDYIAKAVPNPPSNRAPWYVNTAPTYAGIFLWVAFYQSLGKVALPYAGVSTVILALVVAGLLSYGLYYFAPAMLGMKTGYPLYVVGSSTFGTKGGYIMPGLLMGVLQVGWFAVGTYFATQFILSAAGADARAGTVVFTIIAIVWGYTMAWIGAKGIQYVAKVALYLNVVSFLMVLVVFLKTAGGIANYTVPAATADPLKAFTGLIAAVIGFFATAGAAGADFGMNSRDGRDVRMGGLVGVALAILYAGALPILSVAGARAMNPSLTSYEYRCGDRLAGRLPGLGDVRAVRDRIDSVGLLLRDDRRQQFLYDDSGCQEDFLDDGSGDGGNRSGDYRCCRKPDRVLHHRGGFVRADLRRHGGRLLPVGQEVGWSEGRR